MEMLIEKVTDFYLNPQNYMSYDQLVSSVTIGLRDPSTMGVGDMTMNRTILQQMFILVVKGANVHPSLQMYDIPVVDSMLSQYGKTEAEFRADWAKKHGHRI